MKISAKSIFNGFASIRNLMQSGIVGLFTRFYSFVNASEKIDEIFDALENDYSEVLKRYKSKKLDPDLREHLRKAIATGDDKSRLIRLKKKKDTDAQVINLFGTEMKIGGVEFEAVVDAPKDEYDWIDELLDDDSAYEVIGIVEEIDRLIRNLLLSGSEKTIFRLLKAIGGKEYEDSVNILINIVEQNLSMEVEV